MGISVNKNDRTLIADGVTIPYRTYSHVNQHYQLGRIDELPEAAREIVQANADGGFDVNRYNIATFAPDAPDAYDVPDAHADASAPPTSQQDAPNPPADDESGVTRDVMNFHSLRALPDHDFHPIASVTRRNEDVDDVKHHYVDLAWADGHTESALITQQESGDWIVDDEAFNIHFIERRAEMQALGFSRTKSDLITTELYWNGEETQKSDWHPLSPFQIRYGFREVGYLAHGNLTRLTLKTTPVTLTESEFTGEQAMLKTLSDLVNIEEQRKIEFRCRLGINPWGMKFNKLMIKEARERLLKTEEGKQEAKHWDTEFAKFHAELTDELREKHGELIHADVRGTSEERKQIQRARQAYRDVLHIQDLICEGGPNRRTPCLLADDEDPYETYIE